MNRYAFLLFIFLLFVIGSCKKRDNTAFKGGIQSDYILTKKAEKLSSGSKAQYIQIESVINQKYVKNLDSLVNTAFNRQLEIFEENELGLLSSYSNMFSWFLNSQQSWNDKMHVLSNKYFNTLDASQEQHLLYTEYINTIKDIRQQFIIAEDLPLYTQVGLPTEKISLDAFSEHSRNNLVIEFGTDLFSWFLAFVITQIVLLFIDKIASFYGCLIDIVVFIIILIVSIIMVNSNDTMLIESLKSQHNQTIISDSESLLNSINENTFKFYEYL